MAQKMLETMKTISEIISMPWTPEIGDQIFTVIAKIDGVYTEAGWFYATCSQCSKMLEVCNGSFWCNICNGSSRYPMIRFRVHLCVQDDSGDTIFTMYNQQMEHLIDTSAHKLLNRLGVGSDGYPDEIWRLTGKLFAFNVRMPGYFNSDYDFHHHRVMRLTEVDPSPLVSLPANRPEKPVYEKDTLTEDAYLGTTNVDVNQSFECLEKGTGFQELPDDTKLETVEPDEHNHLAEESFIIWNRDVITEDMILRLRNVETGEIEVQIEISPIEDHHLIVWDFM